ncbi:MAG: AbrB/MazE/SpoVT family DNA-binding domain-containing protein [Coriobacteriia bacterium]|nr:AbrB/MazE/SpoVT family DNA-binding domain-containing protein [Coriobacteriia bacterium]
MVTTVTISPKYQVVIPKHIRKKLNLHPGQRIQAVEYDGRIELVPMRSIQSMKGFLSGIDTSVPRDGDRI